MTRKRMYIIYLSAIAVLITVFAFWIGFRIDATSIAKVRLTNEISSLEKKINNAEKNNAEINSQINSLESELSTNDTMNNYYMEYQKQHDQLTDDIKNLKEQSASLDAQIDEKRGSLERNSGVKSGANGKSYSLTKDEIYTCPDKLPAGRYTVKGKGTIVIYGSNGRAKATENLDVAYENSYTFDLKEKEQIKVSENATLTEVR